MLFFIVPLLCTYRLSSSFRWGHFKHVNHETSVPEELGFKYHKQQLHKWSWCCPCSHQSMWVITVLTLELETSLKQTWAITGKPQIWALGCDVNMVQLTCIHIRTCVIADTQPPSVVVMLMWHQTDAVMLLFNTVQNETWSKQLVNGCNLWMNGEESKSLNENRFKLHQLCRH